MVVLKLHIFDFVEHASPVEIQLFSYSFVIGINYVDFHLLKV